MKNSVTYKLLAFAFILFLSLNLKAQDNNHDNGNGNHGDNHGNGNNNHGDNHNNNDNDGAAYLVTPNPSSSFAMVISNGNNGRNIKQIAITDNTGNLVSNNNFGDNVRVATVDVSLLPSGIYTISISNGVTVEAHVLSVNYPICPPYCP